MSTFLFDKHVFGPIHSRRLGVSLGINLLSTDYKVCNFDCIYCECGWTKTGLYDSEKFVDASELLIKLQQVLEDAVNNNKTIDVITFAGNGEPTLHPKFNTIIDATIELRDHYFPYAEVALLSNATTLNSSKIRQTLNRLDKRILKLDAGSEETYCNINKTIGTINLNSIVENLKNVKEVIIQSIFLKATANGNKIDNTNLQEVEKWIKQLKTIQPTEVMIYTVNRDTPLKNIQDVSIVKLNEIAQKVRQQGINANVY